MQIAHMRYLLKIRKYSSLNQAANALMLNPSYLSRVCRSAENEIGVPIFVRTHSGMFPTETGEKILDKFDQIISICDDIQDLAAATAENNNLKQTGDYIYYSQPSISLEYTKSLLSSTKEEFPNIRINYLEIVNHTIPDQIADNPNAVGIFVSDKDPDHLTTSLPENVIAMSFPSQTVVLICATDHPLAVKNKTVSLHGLKNESFIFYNTSPRMDDLFIYNLIQSQIPLKDCTSIANLSMYYLSLSQGDAVSFVATSNKQPAGITAIPIRENIKVYYYFLCNKESSALPVIRYMCEQVNNTSH
jgi:DNA-binding transcriptional LysR family regulator